MYQLKSPLKTGSQKIKFKIIHSLLACVIISVISVWQARAELPAPPVRQSIGFRDLSFDDLKEGDCRSCHSSGVRSRHHLLYGEPVPPNSISPYPDTDYDGNPETSYSCLSCHGQNFNVFRNCVLCHSGTNSHHLTPEAQGGDCKSCHGSVVNNMNDGHYIPNYPLSEVVPAASGKNGLPFNNRGNGAGACNYCHDNQPSDGIKSTGDLHHETGLTRCDWCHDVNNPAQQQIRLCEGCHGLKSLHSIQADSPKLPGGKIVVGGETSGFGHVGRDAGPGDSDCWGCHGFASFILSRAADKPLSGPIIPSIKAVDLKDIRAGTTGSITVRGSGFTNVSGITNYESQIMLTRPDGSSEILKPDSLNQEVLSVTIPGNTAAGNYKLRASKDEFTSNPSVISILPQVTITHATRVGQKTLIIKGSGFGGYAKGSGTAVSATKSVKSGRKLIEAKIRSWKNTRIQATFRTSPPKITVRSVFGTASHRVEN